MEVATVLAPTTRITEEMKQISWSHKVLSEWSDFVKLLRSKKTVELNGNSLTIPIVVAISRYVND
jgi:hypothetical protein